MDVISRREAIEQLKKNWREEPMEDRQVSLKQVLDAVNKLVDRFEQILRDIRETNEDESVCGLCEYDGAFIGQSGDWCNECPGFDKDDCFKLNDERRKKWLKELDLPSAQPERRCVNCGRTVNNGGWYEDGRTRCPIEEHYALPKDGYCHLWEKRKDWEDDYVKRAEEGEK